MEATDQVLKIPQKVKFATLGCRVNQYETQAIRESFLKQNYRETADSKEADVFVLNTCTVTAKSDRENRYAIRKFRRENPKAKMIVTGCFVERNRQELETIPGIDLIVGNQEKSELVTRFEHFCIGSACQEAANISKRQFSPLSVSRFEGRTCGYIKIQDGCNHSCSFCKVSLVRGPFRSRALKEVIEEAKRLGKNGYREIVLTGVQLGAYGLDFKKPGALAELLAKLSEFQELRRIRLSSIEPTDVSDDLIDAIVSNEKICRHLHIPLQSGSEAILERMNRRYDRDFYKKLVAKIRSRMDDFILTTDVIVGFPGETDEQFEDTAELLEELKPYQVHIFPYSPRPGTRSAQMEERVSKKIVMHRRNKLSLLTTELRREVQEPFLGREYEILVEDSKQAEKGWGEGRTANYVSVRFLKKESKPGDFVKVRIESVKGPDLVGTQI
jgi:threonylcarbamoyladenosine tRNA methylthiotransferase MtaB